MKIFKKNVHYDVFVGGAGILLGLSVFVMAMGMPKVPGRFPLMVSVFIMVVAGTIFLSGWRKSSNPETADEKAMDWNTSKYPLGFFAILIVYVVMIKPTGLFVSTSLFIPVTMVYMGVRSWKKVVAATIFTDLFVWLLFVWQLKIQLP